MHADLRNDLPKAAAWLDQGKLDLAGPLLEDLIRQHPLNSYVLYNLGLWHFKSRRLLESIVFFRKAVGADPTLLPALINLSSALFQAGDLRESLRYSQMALRRNPANPLLYSNLGQVLTALGEMKDALEAVNAGLSIDPNHLPCMVQRMIALNEMKLMQEALDAALAVVGHPQGSGSIDALSSIVSIGSKLSRWDLIDTYRDRLLHALLQTSMSTNPMALTFTFDDPELIGRIAHICSANATLPARPTRVRHGERISVAYVSPDLREHPVAHMILSVLRSHDRSRFRIYTVGTLPEQRSHLTEEIAACTDGHIDLTTMDDTQAAQELRRVGIDVLVDLAGTTKWCRPGIFARRPCAAQVLWLGCPCTTGASYYDAFLVDETVAPHGYEAFCTEPLVRLPCCYHPISTGFGTPDRTLTRQDFDLPLSSTIVGVLQQPNKIRPPLIDHVAQTVANHPDAHLWLRVHRDSIEMAQHRFLRAGLPLERQHYAPMIRQREHYLAIFRQADILVDSFPYGGHSTTGEALIQGTPVLTMAGRSIHTRVAASMLHELGLDDLILPDLAALQTSLAGYLASPERLTSLKQRCSEAAARYRINGIARLTRALENAYCDLLKDLPI
jgi:protein O-GlcNAc transferase